jgi:hypothetical protein
MLKCNIKPLENMQMLQTIKDAVKNTHGPTHDRFKLEILDVFEIEK